MILEIIMMEEHNMKIPFMDLKGPFPNIYDEISEKIKELILSTRFIGGEEVQEFEKEFAQFCQVKHAIGCGNGTDALIIALKALGIGAGDVVITVPHTFIATAEAITAVGAKIEFVDIEEETYTMSPQSLRSYLETRGTTHQIKAVIPVHLYGQMADMESIMQIAKEYNLHVIEDAAQAHGAKWKGKGPGEYGDVATFSFFPGKNLGAFGDAGAMVTNSPDIAKRLKMLANHGRIEKYKHEMEGYNSRLDSIQAAVLRIKLKHLEHWTQMRINNSYYYNQLLTVSNLIKPYAHSDSKHVYHLYVIRVKNRDPLRKKLRPNISTGIHYPIPLHLQPAYHYLSYKEEDFPISEKISREIISLPMWPELKREEIEHICEQIVRYV